MRDTRTTKQIEANKLDLEVFRVIGQIDRFANDYRDDAARQMAAILDGMRERVRRHMHPKDRAETNGARA